MWENIQSICSRMPLPWLENFSCLFTTNILYNIHHHFYNSITLTELHSGANFGHLSKNGLRNLRFLVLAMKNHILKVGNTIVAAPRALWKNFATLKGSIGLGVRKVPHGIYSKTLWVYQKGHWSQFTWRNGHEGCKTQWKWPVYCENSLQSLLIWT